MLLEYPIVSGANSETLVVWRAQDPWLNP